LRSISLRIVLVFILLIAAIQPPTGAQDLESPEVLIYLCTLGVGDPSGYIPIITNFIASELLSKGISAQVAESTLDLKVEKVMPGIDALNPLLEYGEDGGYKFVILCVLNEIGTDMDMYFHLIDIAAGEIEFSIEKQTQPILMIDLPISRSVAMIVEKLGDRVSVIQADTEVDIPVEETPPAEEPEAVTEAIIPAASPVVSRVSDVPVKGFSASAGVGTIVFLGSAADYLRAGVTAAATGTYGLPLLLGRFDIGVYAGGFFIEPKEEMTEGSVIIFPAGVFFGYTSSTGSFLDIAFSLYGGLSVFATRIEEQPYLAKAVPFLAGGPGFIAFADSRMSAQIEVLMNVFFENRQMIFGFMPHLSILLR
jgi:hypothetical protein